MEHKGGGGRWFVMASAYTCVLWHKGETMCTQKLPFPPEPNGWHQKPCLEKKSLVGEGSRRRKRGRQRCLGGRRTWESRSCCLLSGPSPTERGKDTCSDGAGWWLFPQVHSFPEPCLHFACRCSPQTKPVGNYCKPIFCCNKAARKQEIHILALGVVPGVERLFTWVLLFIRKLSRGLFPSLLLGNRI